MAIRVSIFSNPTKIFGDILIGQYFVQDERLYCKVEEIYNVDHDEKYNAFCVTSGELVEFAYGEGNIIEVDDIDIAVHLQER